MIIINLHCSIWIIRLRCKWVTYCFFMHHTENIRKSSIKFLYCCQMIWVNFRFRLSFFFIFIIISFRGSLTAICLSENVHVLQIHTSIRSIFWSIFSKIQCTYLHADYKKKNFGRRHITSVVISTWFPASTWSYCLHIVSQLLTGQRPFSIIIT